MQEGPLPVRVEPAPVLVPPLVRLVFPAGEIQVLVVSRRLVRLRAAPPDPKVEQTSDGLPQAVGEPRFVVPTTGTWHVHNGGWSPDSRRIVYTRDMDYGDIFELVEK